MGWKKTGKDIGNAFKNFGKAVATTTLVVLDEKENPKDENGKSKLSKDWEKAGLSFEDAGKSIGESSKETIKKARDGDSQKKEEKPKAKSDKK